jgi:hypothetical protein
MSNASSFFEFDSLEPTLTGLNELIPQHGRCIIPSIHSILPLIDFPCKKEVHINLSDSYLWKFYDKLEDSNYLSELKKLFTIYKRIGVFGQRIFPELNGILSDYSAGDIELDDLPYIIRVILYMNMEFTEFQLLFKRKNIFSFDRFAELLVAELTKELYSTVNKKGLKIPEKSIVEVCLNSLIIHLNGELSLYETKYRNCMGDSQIDMIATLANEFSVLLEKNNGENITYEMLERIEQKLDWFSTDDNKNIAKDFVFYNYQPTDLLKEVQPQKNDLVFMPAYACLQNKPLVKTIKKLTTNWLIFGLPSEIKQLENGVAGMQQFDSNFAILKNFE